MAELTEAEARDLTEKLQSKTQQLAKLLKRAHDGRVWEALNYTSFTDWANNELPFTHGRAFQLLNIGVLTEMLNETVPLSQTFVLSDKQARAISSYGREKFLKDLKAVASTDAALNASQIPKLINAHLNELKNRIVEEPAEEEEEQEKKTRAKAVEQKPLLIDGGETNSRTLLLLGRSLRTQSSEFPRPEKLSPEMREQGMSLLLEAKSNFEKTHDEIVDRLKKLDADKISDDVDEEMMNVPVEEAMSEEVKNG